MTINSQQSLHRSNIVLVLFLDRLQVFQPHFSQLLGFRNRFPSIQLADVLRILGYSGFLRDLPTNTTIFLRS